MVSIVLPCHNRARILTKVLEAYEFQAGGIPFEIIAVDDGSEDDTPRILNTWRPSRFTLIVERQENRGPAAARNRALDRAQGPLILFTGDDIVPSSSFVESHVRTHKKLAKHTFAVLGLTVWHEELSKTATMLHIDGTGGEQFAYHQLAEGSRLNFRYFYTSNLSISKAVLDARGARFDVAFRSAGFEDTELAYRLFGEDKRVHFSSAPVAKHHHFYTVREFSERQYRCGQAAAQLLSKHPRVGRWIDRNYLHRAEVASLWGWRHGGPIGRIWGTLGDAEASIQSFMSRHEYEKSMEFRRVLRSVFRYYYAKGLAACSLSSQRAEGVSRFILARDVLGTLGRFVAGKTLLSEIEHDDPLRRYFSIRKTTF